MLAAVLLAVVCPPPAGAHAVHGRFLGVVRHTARALPHRLAADAASVENLSWGGGPVMHTNTTYAIFWAPAGFSFDRGYVRLIERYLADVASADGSPNVYAVATQYYDETGPVSYGSTYGGGYVDTDPYPPSDCWTSGRPRVCLTDAQIQGELDGFLAARNLPRGVTNAYFLLTPARVASCFDSTAERCSSNYFCGYHDWFGPDTAPTVYADLPDTEVIGFGVVECGLGEQPNNSAADMTIDTLSHEHIGMITNPVGTGWSDGAEQEISDKCDAYPNPLGFTSYGSYDQLIAGDPFELQQEWSNASSSCVSAYGSALARSRPAASFGYSPAAPLTDDSVAFDASASIDPESTITDYSWDFGDGTAAGGPQTSHSYQLSGSYPVTLTITDANGRSVSLSENVNVTDAPLSLQAGFGLTPASPVSTGTAVRFDGSPSAGQNGPILAYSWDFGDAGSAAGAAATHAYTLPGSYTVTLTVTDASGQTAVDSRPLIVEPGPATPRQTPTFTVPTQTQPSVLRQGLRVSFRLPENMKAEVWLARLAAQRKTPARAGRAASIDSRKLGWLPAGSATRTVRIPPRAAGLLPRGCSLLVRVSFYTSHGTVREAQVVQLH